MKRTEILSQKKWKEVGHTIMYSQQDVYDAMYEYTSHLTDHIKSMENYISDVDGQVKELKKIAHVHFDDGQKAITELVSVKRQLESLQKEKDEYYNETVWLRDENERLKELLSGNKK